MKYQLLRRRLSVAAPRMTVRSHVPLWVKIAGAVLVIGAAAAAGFGAAGFTAAHDALPAARAEVERLAGENHALRVEHDRAVESHNTSDSRATMERATIKELGEQIVRLEQDNARLKEDVAFFEAATADRSPARSGDGSAIAIRRLQVVQDRAAHTVRFRILVTQDSRATRDFTGNLQLAVTMVEAGRTVSITVPDGGATGTAPGSTSPDPYAVVFRSYKRIDGTFAVPVDATVKAVQVRILERGVVRVQQIVNPA